MIYLTKFILIYFSFYLSFFINKKFKNFDQPGLNKTHKKKVLNSGGIGPMLILTVGILYSMFYGQFEYSDYFYNIPQLWVAPTSILIFTLISFYDDFNYIPYQVRLCVQLSIIYLCISLFPINPEYNFQTPIFNGMIPLKIDIILTIFFWVFIINSTNFVDGADGMYSFQITSTFFALSVIFYFIEEFFHFYVSLSMFLIGFTFLPFNLGNKFKMYIGDTGSIPSGFVLGWMTLSLINMGYYLSGILINILFLSDVTITLIRRLFNKKSIFLRHNDFIFKQTITKYGSKNYFSYALPLQIIFVFLAIFLCLV